MRFRFFFVAAAGLMFAGACSDDTNGPVVDMVVADTKPTPDIAKPDTQQPKPDLQVPDKVPHFDFTVSKCPIEVNLTGKEPCMCGTTLIYDTKAQYPDCLSPKVVKCCPLDGKPKCEL